MIWTNGGIFALNSNAEDGALWACLCTELAVYFYKALLKQAVASSLAARQMAGSGFRIQRTMKEVVSRRMATRQGAGGMANGSLRILVLADA
eukprot:171808-Pelagomonas_calceolata.AAC.2